MQSISDFLDWHQALAMHIRCAWRARHMMRQSSSSPVTSVYYGMMRWHLFHARELRRFLRSSPLLMRGI